MQPTAARLGHRFQNRRQVLSFRANKDYYKGNRQSALPGHRTGAPGIHVNKRIGYKLLESKVRVFVAPPIQDILACPLKPYVADGAFAPRKQANGIFHGMPNRGLTPEHFLATARKYNDDRWEKRRQENIKRAQEAAVSAPTATDAAVAAPA
ncbi:hypothetical protein C8R46DRAFT_1070628 [Mycena filopes]|nr:hypothetical protein C8R46DRAFT_1070628 [Mycena filopes]